MDFYLGLAQIIGIHTLLGLSAYCVLLTGQVSLAQAGFFAIGAYVAAMLTVLAEWPLIAALLAAALIAGTVACAVGFPALRVKGLMLVVATMSPRATSASGRSAARVSGRFAISRSTAGARSKSCCSSGRL